MSAEYRFPVSTWRFFGVRVRLIKMSAKKQIVFTVNVGKKFPDPSWCLPNMGSAYRFHCSRRVKLLLILLHLASISPALLNLWLLLVIKLGMNIAVD